MLCRSYIDGEAFGRDAAAHLAGHETANTVLMGAALRLDDDPATGVYAACVADGGAVRLAALMGSVQSLSHFGVGV